MMEILRADAMKLDIRMVLWYLKKKLRKEYDVDFKQMEEDLENCGNPVVALIWKEIKEAGSQIKEEHQRITAYEFPMVALWIVYRDTAYNAPFMYIIKKILDKSEKLTPYVDRYYKEPKDWYVNVWHDAKAKTAKLKKEGKILNESAILSPEEEIFTPAIQARRLKEIDEAIKKKKYLYKIGTENIRGEVD